MRDAATGMVLTILLVLLAGFATRSVAAAMAGAHGGGEAPALLLSALGLVMWGAPPVILAQALSWAAAWKRPERRDSALWVAGWAAAVTALWCIGIALGVGR